MKKGILLVAFILAACTTPVVPISTPTEAVEVVEAFTETQEVLPTLTLTSAVIPPTATIPAYTVTSQPPATCPAVDDKVRIALAPIFKDKKAPYHDARTAILNYLNQGGNPKSVIEKLVEYNVYASQIDLTHDGVPEFILPSGYLTVFGCKDGMYITHLDILPSDRGMTAIPLAIQDLNQNGLLELLIGQVRSNNIATYQIYEWDGSEFATLLDDTFNEITDHIYVRSHTVYAIGQSNAEKGALDGNWEIIDLGSGPKRIVIRAGIYDTSVASYELENSLTLQWNGQSYTVAKFLTESTPTPLPTATPLPFSVNCSIKVPELRFQKPNSPLDMDKAILDYLNAGGVPEKLDALTYDVTIRELNNDDAPEIIFYDYQRPDFVMFTCENGKYKEALARQVYGDLVASFVDILAITDNNKNGFPEIFIEGIGCIYWSCGGLYVVEWNGEEFVHRVKEFDRSGNINNYVEMTYRSASYLKDLDGDDIAELIWKGEVMPEWHLDRWSFYPQRLATHIFKWDGVSYTEQIVEYSAPEFRFQAVQDGDLYSKAGFYEKALQSYQQAAMRDSLKWWTDDFFDYTIAPYGIGVCAENITACSVPVEDPHERPILSAYASFKKMVVYLLLDDAAKADAVYQDLLKSHPTGTPGYVITEMAIAFRDEYQSTPDIAAACTRAVDHIKKQPDALSVLTGGYNGLADQGIDYEHHPDEICLFK